MALATPKCKLEMAIGGGSAWRGPRLRPRGRLLLYATHALLLLTLNEWFHCARGHGVPLVCCAHYKVATIGVFGNETSDALRVPSSAIAAAPSCWVPGSRRSFAWAELFSFALDSPKRGKIGGFAPMGSNTPSTCLMKSRGYLLPSIPGKGATVPPDVLA